MLQAEALTVYAPLLAVDSTRDFGSLNRHLSHSVAHSNKVPSRRMRRVVFAAAAAHALQHAPRRHRSLIVASSSKRSVSDLIGNQHGGKYNFDGSYVEGASAGADYGRRRKATVPADEAWAEPTLELARSAASIDDIAEACDAIVEDATDGVLEVTNDEMGWEAVVCEIVGPARDAWRVAGAERIGTSLKSRATTALPVARVADTDDGWAAAVVVFEDRTVSKPRVWPLGVD